MCGIKIDGENHFTIKPIIGGKETYATASYSSIYVKIKSCWRKENNKIIIDLKIPSNTSARFIYEDVDEVLTSDPHHFEFESKSS